VKLATIKELIQARALTDSVDFDMEVSYIKASDLMSDVLSSSRRGDILVTGLVNAQTVRTAEVVDLGAIVYVRGKVPSEETIKLAENRGFPLLATDLSMFEVCGILYSHLK